MNIFFELVIWGYVSCIFIIFLYCLHQFILLYFYVRKPHFSLSSTPICDDFNLPKVTIQLPIYNERKVVERLIAQVVSIKYPDHLKIIQILDDSTDDTSIIIDKLVTFYQNQNINISVVRRHNRVGFKAGALSHGLQHTDSPLIAIFDADFLPSPEFLLYTVPWFADDSVGVIQTQWTHINQSHSLLTELQAIQLNVHFSIEQKGRERAGVFLQFNGTAGIWRRTCIDDGGGWHADTLTEDLDLSYRVQMKGWRIIFLEEVKAPAELPATMNSLKSQQFRWMKGGAETAKKILPQLWQSPQNIKIKLLGTAHLLASSVYLCVFFLGVLSVPLLWVIDEKKDLTFPFVIMGLISLVTISTVYYEANVFSNKETKGSVLLKSLKFIFYFPLFLCLSMGLAFHNAIAVVEGWIGKKSPFIRTPKLGLTDDSKKNFVTNIQYHLDWSSLGEFCLSLYFMYALIYAIYLDQYALFTLHLMLFIGYTAIFILNFVEKRLKV